LYLLILSEEGVTQKAKTSLYKVVMHPHKRQLNTTTTHIATQLATKNIATMKKKLFQFIFKKVHITFGQNIIRN